MEYEVEQHDAFKEWFANLTDIRAKDRIKARIERAKDGNFGDWSAEGGKVRAMVIDTVPVTACITPSVKMSLLSFCAEAIKAPKKETLRRHKNW